MWAHTFQQVAIGAWIPVPFMAVIQLGTGWPLLTNPAVLTWLAGITLAALITTMIGV